MLVFSSEWDRERHRGFRCCRSQFVDVVSDCCFFCGSRFFEKLWIFFRVLFFLGFVYNGWARFFLKIPPLWRCSLCETDWGIEQKGKKQGCCDQDVGSLWDACRFCAIQGFKWEETGQCRGKRILTIRYFLVDSVGFFLGLIASCLRNDGFRV